MIWYCTQALFHREVQNSSPHRFFLKDASDAEIHRIAFELELEAVLVQQSRGT